MFCPVSGSRVVRGRDPDFERQMWTARCRVLSRQHKCEMFVALLSTRGSLYASTSEWWFCNECRREFNVLSSLLLTCLFYIYAQTDLREDLQIIADFKTSFLAFASFFTCASAGLFPARPQLWVRRQGICSVLFPLWSRVVRLDDGQRS